MEYFEFEEDAQPGSSRGVHKGFAWLVLAAIGTTVGAVGVGIYETSGQDPNTADEGHPVIQSQEYEPETGTTVEAVFEYGLLVVLAGGATHLISRRRHAKGFGAGEAESTYQPNGTHETAALTPNEKIAYYVTARELSRF